MTPCQEQVPLLSIREAANRAAGLELHPLPPCRGPLDVPCYQATPAPGLLTVSQRRPHQLCSPLWAPSLIDYMSPQFSFLNLTDLSPCLHLPHTQAFCPPEFHTQLTDVLHLCSIPL